MKKRIVCLEMFCFGNLHVLVRKLVSLFGHPTQVSTQGQLASTCDCLPVCLVEYAHRLPNFIVQYLLEGNVVDY